MKKFIFKICFPLFVTVAFFSCKTTSLPVMDIRDWFSVDIEKFPDSDNKDPYDVNTNKHCRLFAAVKNNDLTSVKEYMSNGANPNVCDRLGQTALMWACKNESEEIVKCLLGMTRISYSKVAKKKGICSSADVNLVSKGGYTALLCAAYTGNEKIFNYLVKKGAGIKAKDKKGENIIHKAVKSRNAKFLQLTLDTYCVQTDKNNLAISINSKDNYGYTPLHYAMLQKNSGLVQIFLDEKYNADIEAESKFNDSALSIAVKNHSFLLYCNLLDSLLDMENKKEKPDYASIGSNVKLLNGKEYIEGLDKYFDLFAKDSNNDNELWIEDFRTALELVHKGEKTNLNEYNKKLEKLYAAIINNDELTIESNWRYLNDMQSLICMDYSKKSVLLKSIDNSNNALLFKLMDEGINIPYGHSDGQNVFYYACGQKNKEVIQNLIDSYRKYSDYVQISYQNIINKNRTSLMFLLEEGNENLCEELGLEYIMKLMVYTEEDGSLDLRDSNENPLSWYIIRSKLPSKIKDKIFDYILNYSIRKNPDQKVDDNKPLMRYALGEKYYYAVKKMLNCGEIDYAMTYMEAGSVVPWTLEEFAKSKLNDPEFDKSELNQILQEYNKLKNSLNDN